MSQNPPKSQMAQSQLGQSCCRALPTEIYGARRKSEGCIADRWRRWMKQFFVRHPSESELASKSDDLSSFRNGLFEQRHDR